MYKSANLVKIIQRDNECELRAGRMNSYGTLAPEPERGACEFRSVALIVPILEHWNYWNVAMRHRKRQHHQAKAIALIKILRSPQERIQLRLQVTSVVASTGNRRLL